MLVNFDWYLGNFYLNCWIVQNEHNQFYTPVKWNPRITRWTLNNFLVIEDKYRHKLGKLLPLEAYYLRLESYLEYHIPINMWFCSVKCDTLRRWNWGIDWGPAVTSLIHYFNIVLLSFLKKEYISVPELTLVTLVFRGNDSYENNFWVTTVNWRNLGTFY